MSAFLKMKIDEVTGIKRPKLSIDADLSQNAENAAFFVGQNRRYKLLLS